MVVIWDFREARRTNPDFELRSTLRPTQRSPDIDGVKINLASRNRGLKHAFELPRIIVFKEKSSYIVVKCTCSWAIISPDEQRPRLKKSATAVPGTPEKMMPLGLAHAGEVTHSITNPVANPYPYLPRAIRKHQTTRRPTTAQTTDGLRSLQLSPPSRHVGRNPLARSRAGADDRHGRRWLRLVSCGCVKPFSKAIGRLSPALCLSLTPYKLVWGLCFRLAPH